MTLRFSPAVGEGRVRGGLKAPQPPCCSEPASQDAASVLGIFVQGSNMSWVPHGVVPPVPFLLSFAPSSSEL